MCPGYEFAGGRPIRHGDAAERGSEDLRGRAEGRSGSQDVSARSPEHISGHGHRRHLPQPVSAEQFNQDKATCTKKGNSAPGAGSQEMKFFIVYTQCMRSSGYAPN